MTRFLIKFIDPAPSCNLDYLSYTLKDTSGSFQRAQLLHNTTKTLITTNQKGYDQKLSVSFQRAQVLGNKIEMEITSLVEQNPTLLRLGLHLEYSDARHRIATHLQRNIDRSE